MIRNFIADQYLDGVEWECCILTSNSIYFTLNNFVENKSSLFAAVVLTAKVSKKSAGFVTLVTFFSRTLLLHIQNYAGYLNNYDPNQLYLRCFRVNNYIRNIQQERQKCISD